MKRLFPLILVLLAIGIFFAYIDPLYTGRIAASRIALAQDGAAIAALDAYTSKENALLAARQQMPQDKLALVGKLLPPSVSNVQTILDLNSLAAVSGIAITSVDVSSGDVSGGAAPSISTQVQGIPAGGSLGAVDLTITALGTYSSFLSFLTGIEKSARLLDVETLDIRSSATGVYTYNIRLRLYWLH